MAFTNPGVPKFLLGKNLSVLITPQDVSSTGVWTDNTIGALPFAGKIEEDSFETNIITQNYRPVQAFNANPVPVEAEYTYTVTEIMSALPLIDNSTRKFGYGNILERAAQTSFYHKIVVTAAEAGTTIRSWTFYCLLVGLKRNSPKHKNVNIGTFKLVALSNGASGFLTNPSVT